MHDIRTRLAAMEKKQQSLEIAQVELGDRIHQTSSEFKEALSSEVGRDQAGNGKPGHRIGAPAEGCGRQISRRTEPAGTADRSRQLRSHGVKTEVGAAKTDIQKTQTDLAATNAKLERAIGDLGVQSGLIAHTAADLEALKPQGRPQLLRLHPAEGRAHSGIDRQPAIEEGGRQKEQVHD